MDKNTIEKILNAALDELYEKDQKLIFNEQFEGNRTHCHSSERSIVHKYAIYFEKLIINELSNNCEYCVDVEYNQNIDRLKILTSRPNGAYPDMILHKRGTNDHNILVAEFKTWWNKDKWMWKDDKKIKYIDEDIKKIKNFLGIEKEKDSCNRNNNNENGMYGYKYKYGVSIILEKKREDVQINFIDSNS